MARILLVCNSDFFLHRCLAPLSRGLVEAGHCVDCVCQGDDIPDGELGPGVVIHQLTFPKQPSPLAFAQAIGEFRKILRRGRYDCVNSNNRNASIIARVACVLERVPLSVYTANGYYFHDNQPAWKWNLSLALEAILARVTDHTMSQAQEDTDLMIRQGFASPDEITTIGNGIDTAKFAPRDDRTSLEHRHGLGEARLRIGAVGRIVDGKGFEDLLEAFGRMRTRQPDDQLVIVGGNIEQDISPFASEFVRLISELGLDDQVIVTGITDEVETYLATCDLFVLPSYREGMPRALLEGMCIGLPTIATDIRGCREIVVDGLTGYIYPPGDIDALVERLDRVSTSSAAELSAMGQACHDRVMSHFREDEYVARQVACLNRLIRAR